MKPILAAALSFLFLPACLETQEEIAVRPDGSCSVRVVVKGQAQDFAEGYPIPVGAEWKLVSADEPDYPLWLRTQMSSEELRQRLPKDKQTDLGFELSAEFPALDALPRWYAPVSDPYRSAYLARTSSLCVEKRGTKTLYSFERRFGAREYARYDAWSRMKRGLPDELVAKVERHGEGELELAPLEREQLLAAAVEAQRGAALAILDDALLAEYTWGGALLTAADQAALRAEAAREIAAVVTTERLREVLELLCAPVLERQLTRASAEEEAGRRLAALEGELRATLRRVVGRGTQQLQDRYAIQAELESCLTAFDQTNDLGDESFRLRVVLPGRLVGGNYDSIQDGAAQWEFHGQSLQDREIVLRAVSILE